MNQKRNMKTLSTWIGCLLMTLAVGPSSSPAAQVPATITTKDGKEQTGLVRWKAVAKSYEFQPEGASVIMTLAPDQIVKINTKAPAELAAAVTAVQGARYDAALPVLTKIVDDYAMIEYDVVAARWAAEAYQKKGDVKSAVAICEKVMRDSTTAVSSDDFMSIYIDCLIANENYARAKEILNKVVEQGSRKAAAMAQLKRGDIELKKGNFKDALIDGYLRTVVLFEDQKQVQPEALYKATVCFDKLGQTPYAEKMRRKLMAEYPDDPFAAKLKSGS
jgi:TolA-binding protein